MTDFICGGEKYNLLGVPERNYICLDVKLSNLPETIEVGEITLVRKGEFHVTLFATSKVAGIYKITDPDFVQKAITVFCEFIKEHPVDLVRFTGEFRLVTQNDRKTVVAMCEVSNFKELTEHFNKTFGITAECPPAHVTLYSLDSNTGIALLTNDDLQNLSKPIPSPVNL